jgi:hypothetical protein
LVLGLVSGIGGEARAAFSSIVASADANITDPNLSGNFTGLNTSSPATFGLIVSRFTDLGASNAEIRSVAEFSVASLKNASIQSVTFTFDESSLTSTPGQTVGVFAYAGSGTIGLADATTSATQVASYDPTAIGLGVHTLTLNAATLQTLLSNSNFLALRFQGLGAYENTQFNSVETHNFAPTLTTAPTLGVTFDPAAVPEPASIVMVSGMGAIVAAFRSRRRLPASN